MLGTGHASLLLHVCSICTFSKAWLQTTRTNVLLQDECDAVFAGKIGRFYLRPGDIQKFESSHDICEQKIPQYDYNTFLT